MTTTVRSASLNGGRATGSGRLFLKLVLMVIVLLVVAQPADCQDQGSKTFAEAPKIKTSDLRPGDVLLYRFDNIVGKLILLFQGGDYNHASIYDGKQVLEATDQGIIKDDLEKSILNADHVDVYRLCDGQGCMGDSGFDSAPVTQWIDKFANAGGDYAYNELILLALICSARRSVFAPINYILDPILLKATEKLNEFYGHGKCIMICSELVYRCFNAVGGRYALKVPYLLATEKAGPRTEADRQFETAYKQAQAKCPVQPTPNGPPPNFVTPRDLQESRSLTKVGRLK